MNLLVLANKPSSLNCNPKYSSKSIAFLSPLPSPNFRCYLSIESESNDLFLKGDSGAALDRSGTLN